MEIDANEVKSRVRFEAPAEIPVVAVHRIPVKMNYSGPAEVKKYFETNLDGNGNATFRGRPLLGAEMNLPQGYTGYVLKAKESVTEDDRCFEIAGKFHKFSHWQLDRKPLPNEKIEKAMQIIKISEVLHSDD